MTSPTPGPFLGSLPSPDIGGARLSRQVDLACSAVAILASMSVWLGAWASGLAAPPLLLVKLSCAVLLCCALMGIWLMQQAAGWKRLAVTMFVNEVGRVLSLSASPRAVRLSPEETPARGIAGLIEALAWRIRRLNAAPSAPQAASDIRFDAVREARAEAQTIVAALYQDAERLDEVSGEIESAGTRLAAATGAVQAACDGTETTVAGLTGQLIALTEAVGATTAGIRHMSEGANALADHAFAGQRILAALDDQSATLLVAAEHIGDLLRRVAALGHAAALEASTAGEPGRPLAPIAADIRELATTSLASIADMQTSLAEMASQTKGALRSTQAICEDVNKQHEAGSALSDAIRRQGEEIAAILRTLDEGRSGFVTLRASVEAVSRHAAARLATAGALRQAAGRLPSHADAMAAVLRDIPDIIPPMTFEL